MVPFYIMLYVYGASLPMPDMQTCQQAAASFRQFLVRGYVADPRYVLCRGVPADGFQGSRVAIPWPIKPLPPVRDDTCQMCIEHGWARRS